MNLLSRIFGVGDAVAADKAATDKLAELNRQQYESGRWSYDQYQAAQSRLFASELNQDKVDNDLNAAFAEGAKEGADKLRTGGDALIGGSLAVILRAVPVWVWILGIGFVLWQLGLNLKTLRLKP